MSHAMPQISVILSPTHVPAILATSTKGLQPVWPAIIHAHRPLAHPLPMSGVLLAVWPRKGHSWPTLHVDAWLVTTITHLPLISMSSALHAIIAAPHVGDQIPSA